MGDVRESDHDTELPEPGSLPPPGDPALAKMPLPRRVRGVRYVMAGLLVLVIVSVVASTYLRIESQLRSTLEAQLQSVLSENVQAVSDWLKYHQSVARHVAELSEVEALAQALGTEELTPEEASRVLDATLSPLLSVQLLSEASLYDVEGRLLATTSKAAESKRRSPAQLEALRDSARLSRRSEGIIVRTVAAVGPEERPTALILVASRPERSALLPSALRDGNTFAFDHEGPLTRTDAVTPTLPSGALEAAGKANASTTGVENYTSAGDVPVVGAWHFIEQHGIGVATEVPQDQALSSIASLRRSFLVLVVLVGAAVLGFIALGRWTLRVREESLLMTRRLGRLARAIQPLSAALENDPSAVVLVDAEGSVVYANAASHRVLGTSSPLFGQDVDDVFQNLHSELHAALISGHDSIVAQGTAGDDETVLVSSRTLTIDGNPHFLYMLRPVTQQVRRQEVEHWKKLIRVLSHELNNALAPITSLLSSAKKVNQMSHRDSRLGGIFDSITERTGHLVSFIEGYREVARLPHPDQKETPWELFLSSLESQKQFRHRGSLPKRPGYFDPVQIERVLVNVLNNAYEAGSSPEDVTIEVLEETGGFRINVSDRGAGMPEPVLKQAMLPFFSTKRTGTGVGLALSREIIEAHGGQLTLANREGGGLVVSCFLPHPIPPAAHPSRSRMPVSRNEDLAESDDSKSSEVSRTTT